MVFVTVGTHEQQFDRLIRRVDALCEEGFIEDECVAQIGFGNYEPAYCQWQRFFGCRDIESLVSQARIVITHGGPASFMMPMKLGKVPIVVPRLQRFGEHVNDHQRIFLEEAIKAGIGVLPVYDIIQLESAVSNYNTVASKLSIKLARNNSNFIKNIEEVVEGFFKRNV
jgi:UDP-N-acetylglucosamine transferase subunit ALG13